MLETEEVSREKEVEGGRQRARVREREEESVLAAGTLCTITQVTL